MARPSTSFLPGSPAAKADIRPGDIIVKVNGVPAFVGDTANQGLLGAFASDRLRLTLKRPTTGRTRTVEAFVLDTEADLYGQHVGVDFIARIRGQERFDSVDDLITAMGGDTERARNILSSQ